MADPSLISSHRQQHGPATVDSHEADMFEGILARRFSCRRFLPEPIPEATIRRMLEIARRTPSSNNAQPWQVIVTSGGATDRLRAECYRWMETHASAPDFALPDYVGTHRDRRRECGLALYASVGIGRGDADAARRQLMENFNFFGAPHAMIVHMDAKLGTSGVLDCGAFASNFVLAGVSLGVESIAQNAYWNPAPFLRAHFGLSPDRLIVTGVSFGHADHAAPVNAFRTSRAPIDEIASFFDA